MDSGNTQEEHIFEDTKVKETRDSSGKLIELADYDLSENLKLKVAYSYDDRGNNVHRLVTDKNGKQVRRLEFRFDEKDREIAYEEFNRRDELVHRCTHEFDVDTPRVRVRWFDKDGNIKSDKVYKDLAESELPPEI